MLAVVEQGGKQYKIEKSQVLRVEKIPAEVGSIVEMGAKMIISDDGVTYGSGKVMAEVVDQRKDKKVIIFKKRRRKNYRRKNGHRQFITVLRVQDIVL